jgi:hypothetical protein
MSETYPITSFTKGNITAPDKQDIPDDACVASKNVDGDVEEGKLRGINKNAVFSSTVGQDISHGAWILNTDAKHHFVYHNLSGNAIKVVNDFYGSKTVSTLANSNISANTCFTQYNREVHVGTGYNSANIPLWVGYIDYGQLGQSIPSGLQILSANPATNSVNMWGDIVPPGSAGKFGFGQSYSITDAGEGETGNFSAETLVIYKFSLEYDNLQESPLCPEGLSVKFTSDAISVKIGVSAWDTYTVGVGYHTASTNPRISAVKLYRATSVDGTNTGLGLFRLIKTFDFTTLDDFQGTDSEGATYKGDASVAFVVDDGSFSQEGAGVTYEAEAGLPQTIETCTVNYALSTALDGYHFVANCYHTELPDARHYIFRSKKLRYDMFDWTSDILRLPEVPTAIVGYEGRLYAFVNNAVYRIDPENLIIENKFEGAGAISSRSVCVTPYGLFFANKNDAYRLYNNEITTVSTPISTSSTETLARGWRYDTGRLGIVSHIPATYCAKKKYVMFGFIDSTGLVYKIWAYHVAKDRWDRWDFDDSIALAGVANIGQISGKDGEVYITNGTNIWLVFGDTTATYEVGWISKVWHFGTPSQKKFLKIVKGTASGLLTAYYGLNNTDPTTVYFPGNLINQYFYSLQLKLILPSNIEVSNIEIVFRRLVGSR